MSELKMNTDKFRKEIIKIMPGYKWTVHRPFLKDCSFFEATGVQTSGFNRTATIRVERREKIGGVEYTVKSSGFGLKAPWLGENSDGTLARALRGLQESYEYAAANYAGQARTMRAARKSVPAVK
jgi:hypothetical protein